jgi:hypothetical protein
MDDVLMGFQQFNKTMFSFFIHYVGLVAW